MGRRGIMAALLANKGVRGIGGGWVFFIAENLILSHNRSDIINSIGDGNYHTVYNTLSTAACGSIGYGFFKHRRTGGPIFKPPRLLLPLGLSCTLLGVVGFSQLIPALQLPYTTEPKHEQQQQQLDGEMKWVNAGLAAAFATLWQISRLNSITSI